MPTCASKQIGLASATKYTQKGRNAPWLDPLGKSDSTVTFCQSW